MTRPIDLTRVLQDFDRRFSNRLDCIAADIDELQRWIDQHGRQPVFAYGGKTGENALALRLYAYAVRLADIDGTESPPSPLAAPFRRRFKSKPEAPSGIVEQWEASQEYWSEGATA